MELKFNISPKILVRLTRALESLAADYKIVHASELERVKHLDTKAGRTYYQDDREIYKKELEEKQRQADEYGTEEFS